jgi:hypothetical protein
MAFCAGYDSAASSFYREDGGSEFSKKAAFNRQLQRPVKQI